MLTFFDYLRQRACEAVLAGAREALDALESQQHPHESTELVARTATRSLESLVDEATQRDEPAAPRPTSSAATKDPLPRARRRGRPRKKSRGNR